MIYPGVQFNTVEGNSLNSDWEFSQVGAYVAVEAVSVHAEVAWGIAQADDPWEECWQGCGMALRHLSV